MGNSPLNLSSLFGLSPGTQCGDFVGCGSLGPFGGGLAPLSFGPGAIPYPQPQAIPVPGFWGLLEGLVADLLAIQTGDGNACVEETDSGLPSIGPGPPGGGNCGGRGGEWCYLDGWRYKKGEAGVRICSYKCPQSGTEFEDTIVGECEEELWLSH